MTREEKEELIRHLKYNLEIGADYLITDKDAVEIIKALEQEPCEDAISRQELLDAFWKLDIELRPNAIDSILNMINDISPVTPRPKTGHCKNYKHFHELPYHTDILGKCIQHTGFYPKGDWYCADFEPHESEVE